MRLEFCLRPCRKVTQHPGVSHNTKIYVKHLKHKRHLSTPKSFVEITFHFERKYCLFWDRGVILTRYIFHGFGFHIQFEASSSLLLPPLSFLEILVNQDPLQDIWRQLVICMGAETPNGNMSVWTAYGKRRAGGERSAMVSDKVVMTASGHISDLF